VLVIGSAMVEITPAEMGRPLSDVEAMVPLPSGSAANFAGVLASLGVRVALMARVGDDELGQWLIDRLGRRGIATDFILPVQGQSTPVSFAWMDRQGEKTFYFYRFPGFSDPMATLSSNEITAEQVTAGRIFDFTEAAVRNEPLRSAALRAARLAAEEGCEVCYAVNYRPAAWLGQSEEQIVAVQREACGCADIVLMNREEAEIITGSADVEQAAREVAAVGPSMVVITAGENGATVFAEGEAAHIPARGVEVVYDIGAGDTFHAGLLAAHLAGMHPASATRFASDTAALRISRAAESPNPTFDEVAQLGKV
jgi:fructokinase